MMKVEFSGTPEQIRTEMALFIGAHTTTTTVIETSPQLELPLGAPAKTDDATEAGEKVKRTRRTKAQMEAESAKGSDDSAPAATETKFTIDEAKAALKVVIEKVSHNAALEILKSFGVAKLPAVKPEDYGNLIAKCSAATPA